MSKAKGARVHLTFPDEVKRKLEELAQEENCPMSHIVSEMINSAYYEKFEKITLA